MTKFGLDRYPRQTLDPAGTDSRRRINVDVPPVTPDEATELMVHHLQLAEAYYQATPDNDELVKDEVERLMASDIPDFVRPSLHAARVWLAALKKYYGALKLET